MLGFLLLFVSLFFVISGLIDHDSKDRGSHLHSCLGLIMTVGKIEFIVSLLTGMTYGSRENVLLYSHIPRKVCKDALLVLS